MEQKTQTDGNFYNYYFFMDKNQECLGYKGFVLEWSIFSSLGKISYPLFPNAGISGSNFTLPHPPPPPKKKKKKKNLDFCCKQGARLASLLNLARNTQGES